MGKTMIVDKLANIPALRTLAPAILEQMAKNATLLEFSTGEVLYYQDSEPGGFFALYSGRVKLYRKSREKTQILSIVTPGECFGAESLGQDTRTPWTAEAMEPTATICLPSDKLQQLLLDFPDLRVVILKLISSRLQESVTLVHNLAFRDVAARLATFLLDRVEEETVDTNKDELRLDRVLTQQELAAIVGTAREVIYRTFKKFEEENLVELTPTHILILDRERLAAIASQEVR